MAGQAGGADGTEKKVDEAWKEAAAKEGSPGDAAKEMPVEASFTLLVTGLMMEALVALGEVENPATRKKAENRPHAKFVIDMLAVLKEKTRNNLTPEEGGLLEGILYELRMKYVAKTGAGG